MRLTASPASHYSGSRLMAVQANQTMAREATFNDLQIQTLSARIETQKARPTRGATPLRLRSLYHGLKLAARLQEVTRGLRGVCSQGLIDQISEQDFEELTKDIQMLYSGLCRSIHGAQQSGLDRHPLHRRYVRQIIKRTETLGDILESFHLGNDPRFQRLASKVVEELPQ